MELMGWDCMENSWNQIFHNIEQQKSIIQTLEKLTYQKLGDLSELDAKADAVDKQLDGGMKGDYDL